MAKLFTSHDPYNVHKMLGLIALLHFLYRFWMLFAYGTAFPTHEARSYQTLGVLAHGLLSWSSLLLPLPAKRNFVSPMIWPEFRFHSIAFASRHVVGTLCTLHSLWPTPGDWWRGAAARGALALATTMAASWITNHYGSHERRTTNSMPYPPAVAESEQNSIKWRYAKAQFAATFMALWPDPTMNFFPLLSIQVAPLLMTLVRKGKCSPTAYHAVYSAAICLSGLSIFYRIAEMSDSGAAHFMFVQIFGVPTRLRTKLRVPIWVCWSWFCFFTFVLYPTWLAGPVDAWFEARLPAALPMVRVPLLASSIEMSCMAAAFTPVWLAMLPGTAGSPHSAKSARSGDKSCY